MSVFPRGSGGVRTIKQALKIILTYVNHFHREIRSLSHKSEELTNMYI
jgi:hypothetical protein